MIYSAKSDVGKIRPNNEDAYLIKNENGLYVFLVCDGMGGHKKGEVASQMARDFVEEFDFSFDGKSDDEILQILRDLVNKANIKIYLKGKNDDEMHGMGTTFSLAVLYNKKVYYAHIGDSRIYVLKDKLMMISKDHTLIGELIEKGVILDDEKLLPAKLEILSSNEARVTIHQGKYHQVKRMFAYTGNKVVKLHRLEFAGFRVDDLKEGEFRVIEDKF